jgi:tyrosyl-tRNA synthetase
VAGDLHKLAIIYSTPESYPLAEVKARDALKIREKLQSPSHLDILALLKDLEDICRAQGKEKEAVSSAKMSKSKPETCIFLYDSPEEIRQKMNRAFCPERTAEFNPVLDICRFIVFREKETFKIDRPAKFGGALEFPSYEELERIYLQGKLHQTLL